MIVLSKSKLLAYRQCPKRLWLEIHRPQLREDSAGTRAKFQVGHTVGEIARRLYDPKGTGTYVNVETEGFAAALKRGSALIERGRPIFEAGFSTGEALAFADVMLPRMRNGKRVWRMIEVKSSTSVKDYHRDDIAIQAHVSRSAGVALDSVALAHIDSNWVYPGSEDYRGLLTENDLTEETFERDQEVQDWIADARKVARKGSEPDIHTGNQCSTPFECGFAGYCASNEQQPTHPAAWLPRVQTKALKEFLARPDVTEMKQVPDDLLNQKQLRVKQHTFAGTTYFDPRGSAKALKEHKLPAYFLDFETVQFAVPIWAGTSPYQQIPFQFSLHTCSAKGKLEQKMFLDLSGKDPCRPFAEALVAACGERGPLFVYNAKFEKARIKELAERFTRLKRALLSINDRIVDLQPIAQNHYYHPDQEGSWGLKSVLPTIVPELGYDKLQGVSDGGMASEAYIEAIHRDTSKARKAAIEGELREYCGLDTFALVKLWWFFAGRGQLVV